MGQKKVKRKNGATIVVGKVLSLQDSLYIKEIFFSALVEKTNENFELAASDFKRIIDLDPANDAALYELASILHNQNKDLDAETLVRRAATVQPDNEWYWVLLTDIYKKTTKLPDLLLVFNELIRIAPAKEDYYYDKASTLLLMNKAKEAELVYAAIEKKFGVSDYLLSSRQRIYQKQGNHVKAAAEVESLIKSNPKEVKNYLELSQIYLNASNKPKAMAVLQEAKKIDPDNFLVHLSLADYYRADNKIDDAFIEIKAAFNNPTMDIDSKISIIVSFFPGFADFKIREQAEELAQIVTQTHAGEAKAFAVYGDVLFQETKYKEAVDSYHKALKINHQVYMIWEQLLRIEISQSDYNAVIKDANEAIALFPNQAMLYFYSGIAYAQKKNHQKAVTYFKNALDLNIEDKLVISQIYASLGDSYNALKDFRQSDLSYDKSLELQPNDTYTLNNYAYYLSLRNEKLDKAEQMSRKSNDLEKNNASFEDTFAWVLFKQKKYPDARVWMEKAISHNKDNSAVQTEHYGDILFKSGEKELAVTQWLKARSKGVKSESLDKKINEKRYIE